MSKYQILHKTETHSAEWCLIEVPTTTNSNKGGACYKQYTVFVKKLVSLPFIWEKQTGMSTLWPLAEMNSTCAVMRMNSMIFRMQQSSSVNPKNIYIHKCRNNYTGNPWHIYETVVDWIIFPPEQNLHRIYTRFVRGWELSGTGYSCHWYIICVVCIPDNTVLSKKDIGIFKIRSNQ